MMKHLIGGAAALIALGACAQPREGLQPDPAERVSVALQAAGVQVYECRPAAGNAAQYEWAFVGPEADLYNGNGQRVGRHYGGPTWESPDGSRVTATVVARQPAPSADSIPRLLLAAKPQGTQGMFARVTSIQRLDTFGGAAPKDTCGPANVGAQARVPYVAQYVFFTR